MMLLCKKCGTQLEDNETVCPVCKTDNVKCDTVENPIDCEEVEDFVEKDLYKKIEKCNVDKSIIQPLMVKKFGHRSQVQISYSDGSQIIMKKMIAHELYPQLFVAFEGED